MHFWSDTVTCTYDQMAHALKWHCTHAQMPHGGIKDVTEECFQKTPLEFEGEDQWVVYRWDKPAMKKMIIKKFTSKMPIWFSGLMPTPAIAPGCRRTGRQKGLLHQAQCGQWIHSSQRKYLHFGFASSDSHHRVETDPADHEHGQGEVIDYVKVPETLEPGWVFVAII